MHLSTQPSPPRRTPRRAGSYVFGKYTELFPLPLMGVNTAHVESLPSYISRLAAAHGLSAVALCQRTIFPHIGGRFLDQAPATAWAGRRGVRLLYRTELSIPIVAALSELAGQTNLEQTIRPECYNLIKLTDHLQKVIWWCPLCAEEGIRGGDTFYFPALWSVVTYPICTIHSVAMIGQCPNCGMKWRLMRSSSWGTHCCRCGHPLVGNNAVHSGGEHADKNSWEWIASIHSEAFLGWAASANGFDEEFFRRNIQRGIESAGSLRRFAKSLGVDHKNVSGWRDGTQNPRLGSVIRLCSTFGIKIEDLFQTEINWERTVPTAVPKAPARYALELNLTLSEIETALLVALRAPRPLPFIRICNQIRVADNTVRKYFRELSSQLVERYKRYTAELAAQKRRTQETILDEAILELNREGLPVTRNRIQKRLERNGHKHIRSIMTRILGDRLRGALDAESSK